VVYCICLSTLPAYLPAYLLNICLLKSVFYLFWHSAPPTTGNASAVYLVLRCYFHVLMCAIVCCFDRTCGSSLAADRIPRHGNHWNCDHPRSEVRWRSERWTCWKRRTWFEEDWRSMRRSSTNRLSTTRLRRHSVAGKFKDFLRLAAFYRLSGCCNFWFVFSPIFGVNLMLNRFRPCTSGPLWRL